MVLKLLVYVYDHEKCCLCFVRKDIKQEHRKG